MDIERLDALHAALIALLNDRNASGAAINSDIEEILGVGGIEAGARDYAGNLLDAMSLIPYQTWFHWNHFGFELVPNVSRDGEPWSNAVDYYPEGGMRDGAPVAYSAMGWDSAESRERLPRMVCTAFFMSRRAPLLKELARRNGRHYVVQTGHGPLLASPEGRLVELPPRTFLTKEGMLVPHDEAVHGHGYIEAPDA